MADGTLLVAKSLTKSYAGVHALRDASLELRAGEVHALVGENGAGKSTLVKILTGAVQPDGGELFVGGDRIIHQSPRSAHGRGIRAIYQQPALFPELSVAENMALGVEAGGLWRRVRWAERRRRAREQLARLGARIAPDAIAGDLTMPEQQLVEIARAMGADARILILDEPTASLSEADTRVLFDVVRQLRERGVGVIYISHRLDELAAIADRVTVLRDGCTIETRPIAQVSRDHLIRTMVGRDLSALFPDRDATHADEPALELRNVGCDATGVHDVTLAIRPGEIVGLAGLVGSGRTQLACTVFGLTPADRGEILVRGTPTRVDSPADAVRLGIAHLPEDRRHHGVVFGMSVVPNITLPSLHRFSRGGLLNERDETRVSAEYVQRLGVKTPSLFTEVSELSGGNQQKVALSRWLVTQPSVLLLDEPTQGIDIGTKSEIHALMAHLTREGVAILLISSDLPELLGMSDRIGVMAEGTIVRWFDRETATQARILAAALEPAVA